MSGYLNFYAKHPALAALAEAINDAGHAYHHTMEWQEPDWMLNDGPHAGKTRCEVIQAAFDAADAALDNLQTEAYAEGRKDEIEAPSESPPKGGETS